MNPIELPDAHFGKVGSPAPDWKAYEEEDPDDEELDETPEDVIAMLGFDPKEPDDSATDAAEFKESEHPRAKNGQFGSGGGGGSSAASSSSKPTYTKPSGPKIQALPKLAKQMTEKLGKAPTPNEFHEALTDLGFDMNPAQSAKYLKLHLKAEKESASLKEVAAAAPKVESEAEAKKTSEALKAAAAKAWEPKAAPAPAPAAAPAAPTDHKASSAKIAKALGFDTPADFAGDYATTNGYPKEGTYNGIDYYKAADGTKISYKPDSDTWMAQDKNKNIIAQGQGVQSLSQHIAANKKEAAAAPPPPAAPAVPSTAITSAPKYGHDIPASNFTYSSKGIANEKGLPPKVQEAVKAYRGSSYTTINNAMRYSDSFDTTTVSPQVMAHILNLQRAFAQIPPSKKDASVIRRISVDALKGLAAQAGLKDLTEISEGLVLKESSVVSSSHGEIGWSGKVKLSINVPAGSKVIDLSETINQGEREVVLPPNSKFKVKSAKNDHNGWHIECDFIDPNKH